MTLRIASLLPSATEIVAALGAADQLVARSHECDFPAGIERLPVLTEAKIDASGPSADIHERMESAVADALSVYRVHGDELRRLAPDVIVTQAQCEVCAVSEDDVRKVLASWQGGGASLVSLTAENFAGVYDDIQRVADALGRPEAGTAAVAAMKDARRADRARGVGRRLEAARAADRMDGAADGGRQLDARAGGAGGRPRTCCRWRASIRPGSNGTTCAPPTPTPS